MKSSLPRLAMAAVLLLGTTAPAQAALFDMFKRKPAAPPAPPPTAVIATATTDVSYLAKGASSWAPGLANQRLLTGDAVKTGSKGKAVIAFSDGTKIQLSNNASFTMESLSAGLVGVKMDVGLLEAWVKKVSGRRFQTRTPTAVASVRGTEFRADVGPSGTVTWDLFGGSIDVANNAGQTVRVEPGQRIALDVAGNIAPPIVIPPSVTMTPEPVVPIPSAAPAPAETKEEPAAEEAKAEETAPEEVKVEEAKTAEPPPPSASQDVKTAPPPESPVSPSSPQ